MYNDTESRDSRKRKILKGNIFKTASEKANCTIAIYIPKCFAKFNTLKLVSEYFNKSSAICIWDFRRFGGFTKRDVGVKEPIIGAPKLTKLSFNSFRLLTINGMLVLS